MFKIKNKLFTIPALIFSAFIFIFTSCGDLHLEDMSKGSVVFNFNSDFFSKIDKKQVSHSRAAFEEYFSYGHYIDVSLEGDFNYSATINLNTQTYISIDDIPVGAKITATLTLYQWPDINDENSKTTLFTGQSEKTTIKAGSNVIKINIAENQYRIYVKLDASKNDSSFLTRDACSEDLSTHNGTKSSPFEYIQSAIYYLADNGESDKDYEIYLTGYNEAQAFNQTTTFAEWSGSSETDILQNKVKSIYLTSETPEIPAIVSTHSYTFTIPTTVPIHFKNIIVKSTYSPSANPSNNGNIIIADSTSANIFLDYNSVLEWENTSGNDTYSAAQFGGAVYLGNSNNISSKLTMSSNSKIKGFKSHYDGGAIYIYNGSVTMQDNSLIENCSTTSNSSTSGGGAIFINNSGSISLLGNASINSCTSSSDGGAVYLYSKNSYLSMETTSSISNCHSDSNGGAVYINAGHFYLSGGSFNGNTSSNNYGNGVYVSAVNTEFTISGDSRFSKDDDIYLSSNSQLTYPSLTIEKDLTPDTVAFISLSNGFASLGTQPVLIEAKENLIKNNHTKFYLNPFIPYGLTTTVEPYLTEKGYIGDASTIICDTDAPVELGDIVLADGNRVKPLTNSENTNKNNIEILNSNYNYKNSIAGVIFYAGNETDLLGNTNLMVGKQWYHDYFDKNTSPTNFDTTTQISGIEVINDDLQVDLYAKSKFSTSEFTDPSSGATYLSNQSNLIKGILQGTNTNYPLLQKVLKYGEQFGESSQYYYNTENTSKNWYIPTIAEYYILYKAFENEIFVKSFNSLCTLIPSSCFVSTTRYGTANYGYLQPQKHAYVYTCNFTTDTLGIDVASNQNYALPIHTY